MDIISWIVKFPPPPVSDTICMYLSFEFIYIYYRLSIIQMHINELGEVDIHQTWVRLSPLL